MGLCTYIIQFTHKKGNGWAIVNANSPAQASSVFLRQTKYLDPRVATVNQSPYEGQEMQLVIEGSVDTFAKGVYDLAVINGFKGTEKDFLDSLKGEKGDSFTFEDLTTEQLYLIARAAPAINNARFDSQNKTISLLHDDEVLSVLDARPFLKDGMLNSVSIVNRRLVLSFNTDAGKEDISLGLDDVFNPNNYYTKTESDARFAGKPFKVTISSTEQNGETVYSADKTYAEIYTAYQAGRNIVAIYEGVEVAFNQYLGGSFLFTIHYDNVVQEMYISESEVGVTPLTFVEENNVATINSQSLTRGGNITLSTPQDLANYCPIIEDTRKSATAVITGNAPFSELVDGQRIILHLNGDMLSSARLQLTLKDGSLTDAFTMYFTFQSSNLTTLWNRTIKAGNFVEFVYSTGNNGWVMVGQKDSNTTYPTINQDEINSGTSTLTRVVTPKLLRENFYLKSEVDNLCPIIEDTRTSAVANITGVAPFATLNDGQKILLKLAYATGNNTTLTLTLSDGTTTGAKQVMSGSASIGTITQVSANRFKAKQYIEVVWDATNDWWMCTDTYGAYPVGLSQSDITNSTTPNKLTSGKLLRDNFYLKSEVDNLCPIIEDTRTSAVAAITGVAPFSELRDGQKIALRLHYDMATNATLNLTLSNGTTTDNIYLNYRRFPSAIGNIGDSYGLFIAGQYVEMFYTAATNRWMCVSDHDTNATYYPITQAGIDAGSSTSSQLVTPKLLVDNFEKRTQLIEVDNQSAQVEQALETNKFYKFLNPVDELTLTLVAPTGYGDVMGIYAGKFTASSTWDSLVLPASVSIASGAPTITAGGTYEFNICDNILMLSEI